MSSQHRPTTSSPKKLAFVELNPKPDPNYGVPSPRSSHGISIVGNDVLILYGGEHIARTPLADEDALWILTLSDLQWRRCCNAEQTLPPARVAHTQAVVKDDVYIFGGRAGITMNEQPMNDVWKFNVTHETWTHVETTGTPPSPRSFHRMVAWSDPARDENDDTSSSLYVFGGCGAEGRMADLHQLDLKTLVWSNLGTSPLLRGRGGANLIPLVYTPTTTTSSNTTGSTTPERRLAVVAGFAGEETNDGHVYSITRGMWEENPLDLGAMRPRSVCVSASLAVGGSGGDGAGVVVIFGGEVDPSERGHEGAGGFENDIVLLDRTTGAYIDTVRCVNEDEDGTHPYPQPRGWSDGASNSDGTSLYIFGGLAGDDDNPVRLNDLWRLDVEM